MECGLHRLVAVVKSDKQFQHDVTSSFRKTSLLSTILFLTTSGQGRKEHFLNGGKMMLTPMVRFQAPINV